MGANQEGGKSKSGVPIPKALKGRVNQVAQGRSKRAGDIGGQDRIWVLLRGGDLRRAAAEPSANGSGVVSRDLLCEESAQHTAENISHATGGHAGMTGAVEAGGLSVMSDDGAGTFEQKRHAWMAGGEGFDLLTATQRGACQRRG